MGAVKSPLLMILSLIIGLVAMGLALDRFLFLAHAQHTTGTVTFVHARNGSCSCGRRCHYACTRFSADVKFPESQVDQPLVVTAGTARGYDQPLEFAQYRPGYFVPVVFDPNNTSRAYRDSLVDIWGVPLTAFFFCIVTLILSFSKQLRDTEENWLPTEAGLINKSANPREPLDSVRQAAAQGNAKAQCNLGVRYEKGLDVERNPTEAFKWFLKAAEQRDAIAQYNLGVAYQTGQGVAKDEAKALRWYREAAEQGYDAAKTMLDILTQKKPAQDTGIPTVHWH